ncbi:MAG TPA: ABC transporter permease [Acidimicrobiales bacterium]|nr:ABC transporter permease [Acidimicrobiales bacterium]
MGTRYALRRLIGLIPTLFGVVTLTFLLSSIVPRDISSDLAGNDATPERVAAIRHDLGLDKPLAEQYVDYMDRLFHGDLGDSITQGLPVRTVIEGRIGPTMLLTASALALSTLLGLALGTLSARRSPGVIDGAVRVGSLVGVAVPGFWLGQLAVLWLVVHMHLFPVQGYQDIRHSWSGTKHLADVARHLMLPAMVLAVSEIAVLSRITRGGLLRELGSEYARTARAKGAAEADVVERHAMRNTMLPIVTVIGTRIGFLLAGSVVIENVFAWPGIGSVLSQAALGKDTPMVVGIVLVVTTAVLVSHVVLDIVYCYVDPRVRND